MNFGAFVGTREGEVLGTIERLLVDIATNQVQGYVVRLTGGSHREVVVPIAAVEDMNDGLTLNLNLATAEKLPEYREMGSISVSAGLGRPDIVELFARTRVECTDGEVGLLIGLVVDEMTNEVTDIVVRLKDGKSVPVPLAWASSLRGDRISFQCARAEI